MLVYIASQDEAGGILRCELDPEGRLWPLERVAVDRPAYLCREGDRLYAVLREPFPQQSGVVSFQILANGALKPLTPPQPVHGAVGCYILAWRGSVYCANYLSGSTIRMPDRLLAHNGRGADPRRQECSHPHCVTPTPDGFLCINDLGTDCLYVCTSALAEVSRVSLPAGSGPRHLVFAPEGTYAYCANELNATVSVLSYHSGRFRYLRSYPVTPEGSPEGSSASAIRLRDHRLYVSTRGYGSVRVFSAEGDRLEALGDYRLPGAALRECNLAGDYLLCGDEAAGRVSVFSLKAGFGAPPTSQLAVTRPWCILPLEG